MRSIKGYRSGCGKMTATGENKKKLNGLIALIISGATVFSVLGTNMMSRHEENENSAYVSTLTDNRDTYLYDELQQMGFGGFGPWCGRYRISFVWFSVLSGVFAPSAVCIFHIASGKRCRR